MVRRRTCPAADPDRFSRINQRHAKFMYLISFLVYSSVSSTVIQTFAWDSIDTGESFLRVDYSIQCYTTKHKWAMGWAGFMFLVYTIGIPFAYSVFLYKVHKDLKSDEEPTDVVLTPLWQPYKRKRYYFECVECIRRVILSGVMVFIAPNTAGQTKTQGAAAPGGRKRSDTSAGHRSSASLKSASMKSASNRAASKKAAPNKAAAGKVASKKGMGEKAWVTKHPSVGLEICPKIPGTSKRDERGAIVLLEEIAECASTVPDAKGFEDITFKGYSERAFGHWRKHILYNVEARLRNDKEYKGDPKLWVHPGSYRDIYKWAESQKQQYSDVRNSHNRTGSEAQSYVPKSALQKARDKVWRDNARCNFPSTCIETSCVPSSASQSTWGETPSKPHANSPLSATSDRNSDGLDTHGVGVADLFGNGGAGDVESVSSWDLEPEEDDLSDGEAEKGFSQSSQPGSAGDKDGGGGGRSAIVDVGGVSSSGAAKGKVPSKGKGKAPGTTPPRSRGRHGHEKKQLETFSFGG
eukprot:g14241.t1